MRLKLDKPTKMWAVITKNAIPCGLRPYIYTSKVLAESGETEDSVAERVLLTVTRVPKRGKERG